MRGAPALVSVVSVVSALVAGCSGGAGPTSGRPPAASSSASAASASGPASPAAGAPLPRVMAALGDSMTRAFILCEDSGGDCPEASWSTGTEVDSHLRRLRALGADVTAFNLAVSGATVASLEEQARGAVARRAGYVTVLVGANDACTDSEEAMTPVAEFAAAFDRGLSTLAKGLPEARVLVLSVPDLLRLWEVGKDDERVRATWERFGVCEAMLANPTSDAPEDAARRARVRDRVAAYNAAMAASCAKHARCRWDGNAVFEHDFGLDAVSPRDYWHPSREGQRILSDVSWRAGFWA